MNFRLPLDTVSGRATAAVTVKRLLISAPAFVSHNKFQKHVIVGRDKWYLLVRE